MTLHFHFADGAHQDDLWALLDRMSELLLMMEAVTLGHAGEDTSSEGDAAPRANVSAVMRQRVAHAVDANASGDEVFPSL